MNKTHTCAERFSCMTHAVDELTQRFPGLTRQAATHIVWDLDMGPIGSDRGIWLAMDRVASKVPVNQPSTKAPWAPDLEYTRLMNKNTHGCYANYETQNAALWIGNDEFVYNTAKACVEFCTFGETPWAKFVRCMTRGQIGRMLGATPDGIRWDDPAINEAEMVALMVTL